MAAQPSERPIVVLAHGAGAPSSSAWMQGWAARLGAFADVATFDYPYMAQGRKTPDRPPVLLRAHADAVRAARARFGTLRKVVLAGKSMGSRMGCHLTVDAVPAASGKGEGAPSTAEAVPTIAALVAFGYPLVGISGAVRDEVLVRLRTPILFVQGTRDKLCPLDRLAEVRARMTAPSELVIVEGGDHSLVIAKRDPARRTQAEVDAGIAAAVEKFVARWTGRDW